MKPLFFYVACLFASVGICIPANAAVVSRSAELSFAEVVNPTNASPSTAVGNATIQFDTDVGQLSLLADITGIFLPDVIFPRFLPGIDGLEFGGLGPLHLHVGEAGTNGPIAVAFNQASFFQTTAEGLRIEADNIAFDPTLIGDPTTSALFLDLHTQDFVSGEIRGQLGVNAVPEPSSFFFVGALALGIVTRRRRKSRMPVCRDGLDSYGNSKR